MKRLMIIVAIFTAGLLASCSNTIKVIKSDCEVSPEELFGSITSICIANGFEVKTSDAKIGYLILERDEGLVSILEPRSGKKLVWSFQLKKNELTATCKSMYVDPNYMSLNREKYFDDSYSHLTWYSEVRDAIKNICGNIKFIEKERPN